MWRVRKTHVGELVQLEGSHHDWFEGRGPQCVLMAYIDDASSRVFARFYEYEGTIPAMDSFWQYLQQYGLPLAIYARVFEGRYTEAWVLAGLTVAVSFPAVAAGRWLVSR